MKVKLLGEYLFEFPESNNPKKFKKSLDKSSKMC